MKVQRKPRTIRLSIGADILLETLRSGLRKKLQNKLSYSEIVEMGLLALGKEITEEDE